MEELCPHHKKDQLLFTSTGTWIKVELNLLMKIAGLGSCLDNFLQRYFLHSNLSVNMLYKSKIICGIAKGLSSVHTRAEYAA